VRFSAGGAAVADVAALPVVWLFLEPDLVSAVELPDCDPDLVSAVELPDWDPDLVSAVELPD